MKITRSFLVFAIALATFALAVHGQLPTTADGWSALGFTHAKEKRYGEAVKAYTECIRLAPQNGGCYLARARAFYAEDDFAAAAADAKKAGEINANNSMAFAVQGDANLRLEKYDEAVAAYSRLIALDPKPLFYKVRGDAKGKMGDPEGAVADHTKAIELNGECVDAHYARATVYRGLGKYEEALADLTKVSALRPTDAKPYVERGLVNEKAKRYANAIADYDKAIALDPTQAWAHNNRGYIYELTSKNNEAIADYTKAITLSPKTAMFYRNRGSLYSSMGKYAEAESDLKKAVETDPKFSWAYNVLGLNYYRQKKYVEAVDKYSKAIELDPKYTAAYYNRGLAHRDLGNNEKATEDFSKATEIDPNYVKAYKEKGEALWKLGRPDEALKQFERLVELEPNNADRYVDRGAAYTRVKKTDLALADFKKALSLAPKHHVAHYNIASYHFDRKEYDLALAAIERSMASNAKRGDTFRARSLIYCKKGDVAAALADEKTAKELGSEVAPSCSAKAVAAAPKPLTPPEIAEKELAAKRTKEAVAAIEAYLADTGVPAKKRSADATAFGVKLAQAGQDEAARKLFEMIGGRTELPLEDRTEAILRAGNAHFELKDYPKAREYYQQISGNFDARVNTIKAFYQEKNHKDAAEQAAGLINTLVQRYLNTSAASERTQLRDLTTRFVPEAWKLANEYGATETNKEHALTIYRAMLVLLPENTPNGQAVRAAIAKLEPGGN